MTTSGLTHYLLILKPFLPMRLRMSSINEVDVNHLLDHLYLSVWKRPIGRYQCQPNPHNSLEDRHRPENHSVMAHLPITTLLQCRTHHLDARI